MKLADVDDDEFLKTGWDDMEGKHIQSYVESNGNGWTADQVGWFLESCIVARLRPVFKDGG